MPPLRILFMGTASFAVPSLDILAGTGYVIPAVVTAPDKPRGRGQQTLPTAVKARAVALGFPVLQPEKLRDPAFAAEVRRLAPDLIVVVAFRILPHEVFTIPRLGSLNLHASLLPRYRGAAPINRAVMNGDTETGVTTFFLEDAVDTGQTLLQARVPILPDDDAGVLHDRLADVGAEVVLHTVRLIEQGRAVPRPQDPAMVSAAPKIFREDCHINWGAPSHVVRNQIRGLSPHPGAFTMHGKTMLKIYRARLLAGTREPGVVEVGRESLSVGTGEGMLGVEELQQEGRKKMEIVEFLRGYRIVTGARFV